MRPYFITFLKYSDSKVLNFHLILSTLTLLNLMAFVMNFGSGL